MSAPISKLEYLKKYMSGAEAQKKDGKVKKKKLKQVVKAKGGVRIIDEEIDLKKIKAGYEVDEDQLETQEDAPQVAAVVDERSEELRAKQDFLESSKWKRLNDTEIEKEIRGFKSIKSSANKKDSQLSKSDGLMTKKNLDSSSHKKHHSSDSDKSPPRRKQDSDSDRSLPRRRYDSDYDSDASPPRQKGATSSTAKKYSDVDRSPPRKRDKVGESKSTKDKSRRRRCDSDSDQSPPRPSKFSNSGTADKHRSRSDHSPPRHLETYAAGKRHDSDSDRSPPRRKRHDSDKSPPRKRQDSDSDRSPPRRKRHDSDKSPPRRRETSSNRNSQDDRSKSSPGRSSKSGAEKRTTTLEGKRAGLQSGKDLRKESEAFRRREDEAFSKMDKSMTGQNAETNLRAGKRRELEEKMAKEREKEEKLKKLKEATERWSKGVKQQEAQSARLAQDVQEMSKPLARFADDQDLERMLREQERDGDPMARYMGKKKAKSGEGPVRPTYRGPPPPPNRFGIPPGYRWDGVDRSNGFEKMYFEKKNKAVAIQDESYKWSVSDM